jgi:membrane protein implicated in regulation of membrane protease activity
MNIWWIWMILAAVFVVGEIFTAAFFLLWFGVGAAVAGVLALMGMGFGWQLGVFIVVSFALFAASRKLAERLTKKQPPGIGADRFVGEACVVLEKIDNDKNTGRVRMDREEWRAESDTGEILDAGTRVVVTRISGTHLVVTKAGQASSSGEGV